jgi:hypothetical protein
VDAAAALEIAADRFEETRVQALGARQAALKRKDLLVGKEKRPRDTPGAQHVSVKRQKQEERTGQQESVKLTRLAKRTKGQMDRSATKKGRQAQQQRAKLKSVLDGIARTNCWFDANFPGGCKDGDRCPLRHQQ